MKLQRLTCLPVLLLVLATPGCSSPQQKQDARNALDAVIPVQKLACIMGSFIVDPAALARVCDLELTEQIVPVVRNLIGFREVGRRAGVTWTPDLDAGTTAVPAEGGAR